MRFRVVERNEAGRWQQADTVYLVKDAWDDWGKYETSFNIYYLASNNTDNYIGQVKIGEFGLKAARRSDRPLVGSRTPNLPTTFQSLPKDFFSLGQDISYYETLEGFGEIFRKEYLLAMQDIAYNRDLLAQTKNEEVMGVSLLRQVPLLTVQEQFARLARGGSILTRYRFSFEVPGGELDCSTVSFDATPNSLPPSNIHVIIGRNGVGKSTLLDYLAKDLVAKFTKALEDQTDGKKYSQLPDLAQISNLVSVSFSAFDSFEPISQTQDRTQSFYHYIGLKKINPRNEGDLKNPTALSRELAMSARACLQNASRSRWLKAVELLENDPIFAEARFSSLIEDHGEKNDIIPMMLNLFRKLSSGHKIVFLTITRLVETVVEKSLVLVDEPEAHLHPPLLSAFVRALSDLLTNRNGMAIVATHSPVVLQEVPSSCVWKLSRLGNEISAQRLEMETFGENIGTLTDEVFGLEVTSTGYHKILTDAAQNHRSYELALHALGGHLGAEGRAILRARTIAFAARRKNVED